MNDNSPRPHYETLNGVPVVGEIGDSGVVSFYDPTFPETLRALAAEDFARQLRPPAARPCLRLVE